MKKENTKYNIQINAKKPSKEEVQSKMDFEGAYKAYTHWAYRKQWHRFQYASSRNKKITMYIILAIIIAYLVYVESMK